MEPGAPARAARGRRGRRAQRRGDRRRGARARGPRGVLLSPGPKTPAEAGISVPLVRACAAARDPLPLFGVCLGHQAIGAAFGARDRAGRGPRPRARHRRACIAGAGCLAGLPSPFRAARYHSLVVEEASLPRELVVTARSREGEIMALRHRRASRRGRPVPPRELPDARGAAHPRALPRDAAASPPAPSPRWCADARAPAGVATGRTGRIRSAMEPFADRLDDAVARKRSPLCVGIDPRLDKIPADVRAAARRRPREGAPALRPRGPRPRRRARRLREAQHRVLRGVRPLGPLGLRRDRARRARARPARDRRREARRPRRDRRGVRAGAPRARAPTSRWTRSR